MNSGRHYNLLITFFLGLLFTLSNGHCKPPKMVSSAEKSAWTKIQKLGKEKNFNSGIETALEFLADNPESTRIHFLLGKLLFITKKYLGAREEFDFILRTKLIHKPSLDYDKKLRTIGSKQLKKWEKIKNERKLKLKAIKKLYIATKLNPFLAPRLRADLVTSLNDLYKSKTEQSSSDIKWLKMVAHFNMCIGKRKKAGEYFMQILDITTSDNEEFLIDNLLETLFKSKEEVFMDKISKVDTEDPEFKEAMDEHTKNMSKNEKTDFKDLVVAAKDIKSSLSGIHDQGDRKAALKNKKDEFLGKIKNKQIRLPKSLQKKFDKMKSEGKSIDDIAGQYFGN